MRHVYFWSANIVFLGHVLLGVFYVVGWYFEEWQTIYVAVLSAQVASWVLLSQCPISYCEFWLRSRYSDEVDTETEIIQHYFQKITNVQLSPKFVFYAGLTAQLSLLALAILF